MSCVFLRMPYTEAVTNEVLRASALVNFGVQHMASADTQIGGYTIPKVSFRVVA